MASHESDEPPSKTNLDRLHDDLQAEYAKLVEIANAFDQRLLTIKSWGVTLGLTSLALGFQQDHYGLFLVAAASGLAFWLLEATTMRHQIRHYPRMGDIEFIAYELFAVSTPSGPASSPLIQWGWHTAEPRVRKVASKGDPRRPRPWANTQQGRLLRPWTFTSVLFPHLVVVVMGTVLFLLGLLGVFEPI
jgi:hypothetical protein